MVFDFKEITEALKKSLADSPLGKSVEGKTFDKPMSEYDEPIGKFDPRENTPINNKLEGTRRENEVGKELEEKYPEDKGYTIIPEALLRDKDGKPVKDPEIGGARRIDFVVLDKDGKVVDSIEVTSITANKTDQSAKESRIRNSGGNYIKTDDGKLAEIPQNIQTRIERRP
jgi:hypothetical protein